MNTVRCPLQTGDDGALFLSYLDRRLDPESMERLNRHVAGCEDCGRVVEAQRAVWRALDEWEPVTASEDFDSRVLARIAAERPWWQRLFDAPAALFAWKPAMPLAAAAAALLAVAVWRGPVETPAAAPTMDTAEAQQVEDTLSDVEMLRQLGVTEETPAARQAL